MHLYAREPGAVLLPAHREVALRGLNRDVAEQKPDLFKFSYKRGYAHRWPALFRRKSDHLIIARSPGSVQIFADPVMPRPNSAQPRLKPHEWYIDDECPFRNFTRC